MIFRDATLKKDAYSSWHRPDRAFFASGACHILAHVFCAQFADGGFSPHLILPRKGFRGTHVFVFNGRMSFDYHGLTLGDRLLRSYFRKLGRRFRGWEADVIPIPHSLIGPEFCAAYSHRRPDQYLHDPIPRAERFLERLLTRKGNDCAGGKEARRIAPCCKPSHEPAPGKIPPSRLSPGFLMSDF